MVILEEFVTFFPYFFVLKNTLYDKIDISKNTFLSFLSEFGKSKAKKMRLGELD